MIATVLVPSSVRDETAHTEDNVVVYSVFYFFCACLKFSTVDHPNARVYDGCRTYRPTYPSERLRNTRDTTFVHVLGRHFANGVRDTNLFSFSSRWCTRHTTTKSRALVDFFLSVPANAISRRGGDVKYDSKSSTTSVIRR